VAIDLLDPSGVTYNNVSATFTITGQGFNTNIGNTTYQNGSNTNFYILLPDVNPGMYLLRLATQNFYSCALINISAQTVPYYTGVAAGESIDDTSGVYVYTPGQSTYFTPTFPATTGLLLEIQAPVTPGVSAYVSYLGYDHNPDPTILPSITNAQTLLSSSDATADDSPVYVGACANGMDTQAITYTIAVALDPGYSLSNPFSVTLETNNLVRLNVPDGNRTISFAHEDYLYFYTQASSGIDGNVCILLTVPTVQSALPTEFIGANDCSFTTGEFSSKTTLYSNTICLDLPTTTNTKYIRVSQQSTGYTIGAQKGSCSNLNSGAVLTASVVFVFLSVLISLLF